MRNLKVKKIVAVFAFGIVLLLTLQLNRGYLLNGYLPGGVDLSYEELPKVSCYASVDTDADSHNGVGKKITWHAMVTGLKNQVPHYAWKGDRFEGEKKSAVTINYPLEDWFKTVHAQVDIYLTPAKETVSAKCFFNLATILDVWFANSVIDGYKFEIACDHSNSRLRTDFSFQSRKQLNWKASLKKFILPDNSTLQNLPIQYLWHGYKLEGMEGASHIVQYAGGDTTAGNVLVQAFLNYEGGKFVASALCDFDLSKVQ